MYVFIVAIIFKLYKVKNFLLVLIYCLKCFVPDGKLMDGQVIQLEDGSAAYVQHVPIPKSSKYLILISPSDFQYLLPSAPLTTQT